MAIERVEAEAARDRHAAALAVDRETLGLRCTEADGASLMAADRVDSLFANRALGVGLATPATGRTLEAVLTHYRGRVPNFALNLCPFAEPGDLPERLMSLGFGTFFHHVKWVRGPGPVRPADTRLRIATARPDDAPVWAALAAQVFEQSDAQGVWAARTLGRAGWHNYLAFDGAEAVALAAVFVKDGAAWLGSAGTKPSHRGRGAQSALLARRITDALAAGAEWLTLETAPDMPHLPGTSLRNAARAGFHPAYERPSWIWPVP